MQIKNLQSFPSHRALQRKEPNSSLNIIRPIDVVGLYDLGTLNSKTNNSMKKLSNEQLQKVHGGYSEEGCKRVQYMANKYGSIMSEDDWDLWLDAYDALCV